MQLRKVLTVLIADRAIAWVSLESDNESGRRFGHGQLSPWVPSGLGTLLDLGLGLGLGLDSGLGLAGDAVGVLFLAEH